MATNKTKQQPKLKASDLGKLSLVELKAIIPGGKLSNGSHNSASEGACLMEAVSWVTGEDFTDHPECACPVLTELAININDNTTDKKRQALIPAIPVLVGSKTDSGVLRFLRAKEAVRYIVQEFIGNVSRAEIRGLSIVQSVVFEAIRGRAWFYNERDITELHELFQALGDDILDSGATKSAVEELKSCWNAKGISQESYERILSDDLAHSLKNPADFLISVASVEGPKKKKKAESANSRSYYNSHGY